MITIDDVQPIIDDGTTDAAAIAAELNADPRYKKDIPTTELMAFLINDIEALSVTTDGAYNGPLKEAIDNAGSETLTKGFRRLLTNAQLLPSGIVHTAANPDVARLAGTMVLLIVGPLTPEEKAPIVAGWESLTGGRKFENVTAENVQSAIDDNVAFNAAETARKNRESLETKWGELLNDGINEALATGDVNALKTALSDAVQKIEDM